MAELVVGPLLSMVKDKACSYLMDKYKVMQGMEKHRKILERKLPAILDIIEDAEEKGVFRPGVAAWLKDLKAVAFEANDVFDEFSYEALRRQAKKMGHHSKLSMEVVDRNPIVFRYRMGKNLCKIVKTIEVLVTEMNAFGFNHLQHAPPSKPSGRSNFILADSDKDIVTRSRDKEKNKIVGMLIHEMDMLILPIVGMGGLGKTTFIQLVYNDPEIEKHFQLRRWCSVSDSFDTANIARSICQTNENDQGSEKALKNLQKLTNGKRYLIVLDDVWNRDEEKWGKLLTCLKQGDKGSVVLATTRDAEVGRIMTIGASGESYNLEKLSNNHLKEIIQSRVFSLQQPCSDELVHILDRIIDRCAGSPMAAKAFGSMLSTKTSLKEWKNISEKSNICNETTGILPLLKISFDELPSQMKQCFAFCAMFPKNYEINVEFLIKLWIANDLIPVREGDHPETAGEEIFKELTWRSFFGELKETSPFDYGERLQLRTGTVCKMHDLMHDIALSVAWKECATIVDETSMRKLLQNSTITRHLFWSHESNDLLKKEYPPLRTLFCTDYNSFRHISKYTSLRALHLPHMELHRVEVRQLQHLRYLNLSGNLHLKELPEDISILYNLQTLNLSHCEQLRQLPKDMKYMASLRHLYTNGCKLLTCMPPGLGQITSLQTLTYFVVGSSSGCSTIRELQNLNLGGELELNCLENATEALAKSARLENKEKLTHLSLEWNSQGQEEPLDCHQKVLRALKPHVGLQMLRLINYKGNRLPLWITDHSQFQHLTELHLLGCMFCEEFPWFSHFKALEVLHLESLNKLQSLCSGMASMPFPALKELWLHDLESLERWVATEGKEDELAFPLLEEMDIKNCPKLTSLPEAPKLKVMRLDEDKVLLSSAVVSRHVSSLSKLQLCVRDTEATPPQTNQDHESSLEELILQGCQFLFCSDAWRCFRMVVCLEITGCDFLVYWPEEIFRSMALLKNLGISNCSNLIGASIPNTPEKDGEPIQTTINQVLPYLDMINIFNCDSLKELFMLPLSRHIFVCDCPRLEHIWREDNDNPETSISRYHTCLEAISIVRCANLVTLPNLPPSLKDLEICVCVALRSVSGHLEALENLIIIDCGNLVELLDLPPTLKELRIKVCGALCSVSGILDALEELQLDECNKLQSLESVGELPLLQILRIESCDLLAVLPRIHGSYLSLRELRIKYCPAIDLKQLYSCHQQRLDGLEDKDVSHAHSRNPFEGPKLRQPETWHYAIPWCRDRAIQRHIN